MVRRCGKKTLKLLCASKFFFVHVIKYFCSEPHRGHASRIFCCLLHFVLPLPLPVAVLAATFDVNCIFYGSLIFLMLALLPVTFFTATFAITFTATSTASHIFHCHFHCHFYCQPHFLLPLLLPVVLPVTFFTATRGRERKMARSIDKVREI